MAYSSHIRSSIGNSSTSGQGGGGGSSTPQYGRVVHVVLSQEDPYFEDLSMINGIYYRILGTPSEENEIKNLPFAYCGNPTIKRLPLPGEIVNIVEGTGVESLDNIGTTVNYWQDVLNIWNHPHHNAAPDTFQPDWKSNNLKSFPHKKNINPLLANPGDIIIEGRFGQSIRIGGAQGSTGIVDSTNNGDPFTIIRNGQKSTSEGSTLLEEDINEDPNSIYLLSNHSTPLLPANNKLDSHNTPPTAVNQYKGNQVIVTGGRLVFNAKQDHMLLLSKESITATGKTVNIDGNEFICLDSPKIFLGKAARTSPQSNIQGAVLGKQLERWLETLLNTLENLANAMNTASAVGAGPVVQMNVTGPVIQANVNVLRRQLKSFQSKKVFIE